jgi:DNA invertase Pin-like site-specific DNA recombinase
MKSRIIGYLRVSTNQQDVANQRYSILEYTHKEGKKVNKFFSYQISSRKSMKERGIDELLEELKPLDCLIVSELSRLGRSLGQIIRIIDELIQHEIEFIAIKERIHIKGKQDKQNKIMVALFGLFAELERDLISERTKEGISAAKKKGVKVGRPKGKIGKSKLDGKEKEIEFLLSKHVSKASISKMTDVAYSTLVHFIESRNISKPASKSNRKKKV